MLHSPKYVYNYTNLSILFTAFPFSPKFELLCCQYHFAYLAYDQTQAKGSQSSKIRFGEYIDSNFRYVIVFWGNEHICIATIIAMMSIPGWSNININIITLKYLTIHS